MFNLFGSERLRLVQQSDPFKQEGPPKVEQLSFDFPENPEIVLILESSLRREGFFLALVKKFRPCFVFDTRTAPRLDFIATNRVQAFRRFDEINIKYMDLHWAMESSMEGKNEADNWLNLAVELVEKSSCKYGPYFFIFDSDVVLHESCKQIPKRFMKAGRLKAENALVADELCF